MKLVSFQVRDFKSVYDSGRIDVSDVTCLVGKNESGKTSLLQALYRLNPIIPEHQKFDVTDDYPRAEVEDYRRGIEDKTRGHSIPISATFELEDVELAAIEAELGKGVLTGRRLRYERSYADENFVTLREDERVAGATLLGLAGMDGDVPAGSWSNLDTLVTAWYARAEEKAREHADAMTALASIADPEERKAAEAHAMSLEETSASKQGRAALLRMVDRGLSLYIWDRFLRHRLPKFLYFDEYYQMPGHVNIEALKARQASKTLLEGDHPMLGLIDMARLNLDELLNSKRTEEIISKLEGASNHLSRKILKYWSQNQHLGVRFDVRPARPGDPKGMETGTNLLGRVHDSVHFVSTPLGTRSKGFVWFFSFIAWFSQLQKRGEQVILLLDEPGLELHGTAQGDLLRYIEEELMLHQVIYTTHSPFMVQPTRFDRVRIVEDKSMDATEELPIGEAGTKVYTNIMEVSANSLFPLQGALGYEISQKLFAGANCLAVDGVSDLIYLQEISGILRKQHRVGLSDRWTITPVGGSDKIAMFVALVGTKKNLKIATLLDVHAKDRQQIDNLYRRQLLQRKNVLTFADFTAQAEADIEDMFDVAFYLDLVNEEFTDGLTVPIAAADLAFQHPRVLVRLEKLFELRPLQVDHFDNFRPARYFLSNIVQLETKLGANTLDRFEAAFKALNALL
ncbi:MAG: AAA family ATPase [Terracidiphilus sp.]|jgi:energy-coupling factor transporter ATP-binding protein EcfA2